MDPKLPFPDESFDVVTCVVSVDYLNKPLEVFKEVRLGWVVLAWLGLGYACACVSLAWV